MDKSEEEEDGYDKGEDEVEEYEDDDFVGESGVARSEGQFEDEELGDDNFDEEDSMLDVEIEDLSGKPTGLKSKKEVLSSCFQITPD